MTFRLRTIELTATGREIVRDNDIAKDRLTIGRASESDVHLTDLAVEPDHAVISIRDGNYVDIKSAGSLGFTLDGSDAREASIDSRGGAELGFGTYRIQVSRDADDAILLTVSQVEDSATKSGDIEEKKSFSLAGVLPGKRGMAWGLALVILIAFLAVPIFSHLTRDVKAEEKVVGDGSWSAGALSLAHHKLEDQCEACHVKPFESVRDETCVGCHEDIHDHADPKRLAVSRGEGSWGDRVLWSVAHSFGKEGPGACSECHTEHEGPTRLTAPSQKFCADCHGSLDERLTDARIGNAADFGTLHPEFTAAIITDPAKGLKRTVSLAKSPRENNGLKFPHKLHLDKRGGVARMAANIGDERGYGGNGMQCKDCHRPSEDGIRFQTIEMEQDCETCHSLTYDKVGGIFRKLRHGDVDQVIADLTAASPTRAAPIPNNRRRPGNYAQGQRYNFNFSGPAWKGLQIRNAMSRNGVCGECHTPMTRNGGRPGVIPVTLVSRYMHQGWFDHDAHKQEKCTSCHLAEASESSSDLLLPRIKLCRDCHLGEDAAKAEVPSSCAMCHGYHVPAQGSLEADGREKQGNGPAGQS